MGWAHLRVVVNLAGTNAKVTDFGLSQLAPSDGAACSL
jgi:hypothetical protein